MDKYEYKVRADEIKQLISQGKYAQAAEIADTIDWRRIKSVMMLCTISDLYKINRRYEDARDMLLLAYDRRPGGRTICYSLCELSVKIGDYVQAVEYYKEFVQVAPTDPSRYILQYKIYEAQEVSLEERIEVLEELKKRDYREKWAYELAYLYHRIGLATRCVEECDELILWFGEGKYVIKAMELKMLHQPLTRDQQNYYENRFAVRQQPEAPAQEVPTGDTKVFDANQVLKALAQQNGNASGEEELDIHVKTVDVGEYNTINLQAELAAGLREVLAGTGESVEFANEQQTYEEDPQYDSDTESLDSFQLEDEDVNENDLETEEMEQSEVFFGETGEIGDFEGNYDGNYQGNYEENYDGNYDENYDGSYDENYDGSYDENYDGSYDENYDGNYDENYDGNYEENGDYESLPEEGYYQDEDVLPEEGVMPEEEAVLPEEGEMPVDFRNNDENYDNLPYDPAYGELNRDGQYTMLRSREQEILTEQPPKEMAEVLSQEADGQISLVVPVPETENLEKQITGQMSIEDILKEWERLKQENLEKREQEVRRHVLEHTGDMFTEFEMAVRDGLLEKLENGEVVTGIDEAVYNEASVGGEYEESQELESSENLENSDEVEELEEIKEYSEEEELKEDALEEVTKEDVEQTFEEVFEENEEYYEDDDTVYEETEEYVEGEEVYEETEEYVEGEEVYEETEEYVEGEEVYEETEEYVEGEEVYEETEEYVEGEEVYEETEEYVEGEEVYEETEEYVEAEEVAEGEEVYEETEEATEGEEVYEETEEIVEEEEAEEASESDIVLTKEYLPETGEIPEEEIAKKLAEADADSNETADSEEESDDASEEEDDKEATEKDAAEGSEEGDDADKEKLRNLTVEEKELFAPYIQSKSSKEQLIRAIDNISMAAYTGNLIITGEEGMDTLTLAKNIVREIQAADSNFSGKVAKISGDSLNRRDIGETLDKLKNGALIIEKASGMSKKTVNVLYRMLQKEDMGIVIILEDTKKRVKRLLSEYEKLSTCFTARIDVEAMSNDSLVAFGKTYARELEFAIDDLGVLALHTKIENRQTSDHIVTVLEVKDIVDEAIAHAKKKNLKHFMDVLLGRRYDSEDMIILSEKDFV